MRTIIKYIKIVKELKLIQIVYRAKYIIKRRLTEVFSQQVTSYYYKKAYNKQSDLVTNWNVFLINKRKYYKGCLEEVLDYRLCFLNHEIVFPGKIEWHHLELNKGTRLWKLNLHYHEWLVDIATKFRLSGDQRYLDYLVATISDWIDYNPIGTKDYGKDNWNSYCISLRAVAWIKIISQIDAFLHQEFRNKFLISLRVQADFLSDNLELDILGNHLIKNWKALIWVGHFFNDTKYINIAKIVEKRWVLTQFTSDGMHEEMSPMYTGIVLEDLLEVYSLAREGSILDQINKTASALAPLTNGNQYLFFNDSVNRNEVSVLDLNNLLTAVTGKGLFTPDVFNVSGYVGVNHDNVHLVYDTAPAISGPQPGHLKCDQLSFELFIDGIKIFTNSGVFEYNDGECRRYARATEAHNTMKIGDYNQSEVLGSFRVMKKAITTSFIEKLTPNSVSVVGKVSGFDFKNSTHTRKLNFDGREVVIEDFYVSQSNYFASIYFHFHPDIIVRESNSGYELTHKDKTIAYFVCDNSDIKVIETDFYPEFGKRETKQTIVISNIPPEQTTKSVIKIHEKNLSYI